MMLTPEEFRCQPKLGEMLATLCGGKHIYILCAYHKQTSCSTVYFTKCSESLTGETDDYL